MPAKRSCFVFAFQMLIIRKRIRHIKQITLAAFASLVHHDHLVASGKTHGFSRVAAGTWGIFSSYDGDAHSKRELVSEVRTLV